VLDLWGKTLSYGELEACEALGWVHRRWERGHVSWTLTEFGAGFSGPIHVAKVGHQTLLDELRETVTEAFAGSVNAEAYSPEMQRLFEILQDEGVVCRTGDDASQFKLYALNNATAVRGRLNFGSRG
jgi:hypothetical protein